MTRSLLRKLERYHGYKLVSRALAYIAAARFGLSEDELIDVLSFDEEVMKDVLQYHTPDPRALPPIVLLRLLLDSGELVTKRNVLKAHRFFFYHNQFKKVIETEYMNGDESAKVHSNLGKFFINKIDPVGDLTYKGNSSLGFREVIYHLASGHEFDLASNIITDLYYLERRRAIEDTSHSVYAHGLYEDFQNLLKLSTLSNVRLKDVEQLLCFFIDNNSRFYSGIYKNRILPWDTVPTGSMWSTQRHRGTGPLYYSDEKQSWCCFNRSFVVWQRPPNPFLWSKQAAPNGYILDKNRLINPQASLKAMQNPKPGFGGPPQIKSPGQLSQASTDTWGLTTDDYTNTSNTGGVYAIVVPRGFNVNDLCSYRPPLPQLLNDIRKAQIFSRNRAIEAYISPNPFD